MFSLEFHQVNAAFGENGPDRDIETARILRAMADKVEPVVLTAPLWTSTVIELAQWQPPEASTRAGVAACQGSGLTVKL